MMMPANYSAIAENEMTYVVGGGAVEWLGSFTAPIWDVNNLKTFNTNVMTMIGNTYMKSMLADTLGLVFTGSYGLDNTVVVKNVLTNNAFTKTFAQLGNKGTLVEGLASVVGTGAAIWNLGRADVKNYANGNVLYADGSKL